MLAPIPRYVNGHNILPHNCILRKTVSPDPWGGGGVVSDTKINFVRIEPCHSQKFSIGGDIPEVSAKLFYDSFSSSPNDVRFESKDKIIFEGKEYVIVEVRTFYGNSEKVHHLEVMLS